MPPRQRRGRGRPANTGAIKRKMLRKKARTYRTPKFHFKRGAELITYNGTGTPVTTGFTFTLGSLLNVAEFTTLFDMYRINAVMLRFHYRLDPGSAPYGNGASYPRMFSVKDYDDSNAPANVNELREYSNCKMKVLNPNKPLVYKITPAIKSAVGVNSTPKWKQWLDCQFTNTDHFGFKWIVDNLPSNSVLELEVIYYVSFKHAK